MSGAAWEAKEIVQADAWGAPRAAPTLYAGDGWRARWPIWHAGENEPHWDTAPPVKVRAKIKAAFNRATRAGKRYDNDCRGL